MTLWKEISWIDNKNKWYTIKNVLPNKGWGVDNNSAKIEPSTIQLVKETSTSNSDG